MIAKWIIRPQWQGSDKPNRLKVTNDCCFAVDGIWYWIPGGYEADGASVPKPLWYIAGTPFEPDNAEPGIAHDALYLTHAVNRGAADEILFQLKRAHELMIGTRPRLAHYRAWKMWAGVRAAGGFAWPNNGADKAELVRLKILVSQSEDWAKYQSLWFSVDA